MNKLSVVIPSRNIDNLVACVGALREHEPSLRVIVVDDGVDWNSRPNFKHWVEYKDVDLTAPKCASGLYYTDEELTSGIEVKHCGLESVPSPLGHSVYRVEGKQPFCFSEAINTGIRMAGEDSVCCLNDDALLKTPGGFTGMRLALDAYNAKAGEGEQIGIVASSCNNVGNTNQHRHRYELGCEIRIEPWVLCFICVLIPRSTIDSVGVMDCQFTAYGCEDNDLCLRIQKAGMKLGICDACFVDHHSLKSSFRAPSPTNSSPGDFRPNLKLFIEKWGVDTHGKTREESAFPELFPSEQL